ncbi:MAG: DUF6263 family protein [Clostridiaceae bacterium]
MKKFNIGTLLALALLFLVTGCSNSKVGFNPNVGDGYKVKTDLDYDFKMTLMNQSFNEQSSQSCNYTLKAENKDSDGNIELSLKYDRFKMNMNSMGQSISIDTEVASEEEKNLKIFKNIIGQGFDFKVDKDGNITEVSGIDELITKVVESGSSDSKEQEEIKSNISKYFSEDNFKSSNGEIFVYYPKDKKNLKVGDTWEIEQDINGPFDAAVKYKFKVINITSDLIEVSITTDDNTQFNTTMNVSGQDFDTDFYMKVDGRLFFDKKTGLMKTSNLKIDFDGTLKANVSEKEIEIPCILTISNKISIEKQ